MTLARRYVNDAAFRNCYLISSDLKHGIGKETYRVNSPDYDQYLSILKTTNEQLFIDYPTLKKNAYIVYLDNYFPFHRELFVKENDWQNGNEERAESYFGKLNAFFNKLENYYKMPVVIAAHPTANYSKSPYNDRLSICYRSSELVKDCYGVVTTSSVSFSFAVLFKKPLILFTSDELFESTFMSERIFDIGETLGIPIHRLEKQEIRFNHPQRRKRKKYINDYMCGEDTADRYNVDLLRDALINILNK